MNGNAWSRQLVEAAFDDDQWADVVATHDPILLASELKRIIADIGQQEMLRANGMAAAKDDPDVTDDEYATMKAGLHAWRRSIARVRPKLQQRRAEVQPLAQVVIDSAQHDRRMLVILAKRVWLWEEGLEDRLDYALDDCTISAGDQNSERRTLRQVVEDIAKTGPVTP